MADAFEQELLADITEAEAIGEHDLAAEWRWELKTYRAAKKQAILEEQAWAGVALGGPHRAALVRGRTPGRLWCRRLPGDRPPTIADLAVAQ